MKPVILVTRKLPDAVEERLRRVDERVHPVDVSAVEDDVQRQR